MIKEVKICDHCGKEIEVKAEKNSIGKMRKSINHFAVTK